MGEVSVNPEVRKLLSTDSSILEITPAFVVYPKDEQDIRKTMRFSWQLAERGKKLPVTARGGGGDTSGAAIGAGAIIYLPAHMNRILSLDAKKRNITLESGISADKLEQTLSTHGLFLPMPRGAAGATIGGLLANNSVSERSVKYGELGRYVDSLRVVLANGEVIETGPLNKKELSFKMGLSSFEGQIYRALDALIEDNYQIIEKFAYASEAPYNGVGYQLSKVKNKSGFDLTPLFVGSQGTLGIISEATMTLRELNENTALALVSLQKLEDLKTALPQIIGLKPSLCEIVSKAALAEVGELNPKILNGVLPTQSAEVHLVVEFDDPKESSRKHGMKSLSKICDSVEADYIGSDKIEDKQKIDRISESLATLFIPPQGKKTATPVAEDLCVAPSKLADFLVSAQSIFSSTRLPFSFWGHAGSGIIKVYPSLDLSEISDRQKFFKLSESLYNLATSMGGSVTASAGEGRIRAPYVRQLYGEELFTLTSSVKAIFDPYNILNPGVKTSSIEEVKTLMRSGYSLAHQHGYRPRG